MILHSREEWTARPVPTGTPARNVGTVFVHHEGGGRRGDPANKPQVLRDIEAYVIGKGYAAIDYNLMVFQDGSVWEGRGLDHEDAATLRRNADSVSVCAVGNYAIEPTTPALLQGIADAVRLARTGGWARADCAVLGHRDAGTFSTSCPGDLLYAQLPTVRQILAGAQPEPPPAAPPRVLLRTTTEGPMQTLNYPVQHQIHTFYVGSGKRDGHLCHSWQGETGGPTGWEDLTDKLGLRETLEPAISAYIGAGFDLVVDCVAADGALVQFRWPANGNAWGVRIVGGR